MSEDVASYLAEKHQKEDSELGILARAYVAQEERISDMQYELDDLADRKHAHLWRSRNMLTIYRPRAAAHENLPTPRLQFRWAFNEDPEGLEYRCWYELIFLIRDADCRGEIGIPYEACVTLGATNVGGQEEPWKRGLSTATPFRDGAHATWDSEQFGGLPIWIIAPDGRAKERATNPTER